MGNTTTMKALTKSLSFDFKPVREEIRQFVLDNADCINVHAVSGRRTTPYSLATAIDAEQSEVATSRNNELIDIIVEMLAQNLLSAALVAHFSSVPVEYENCLFKFAEELYIRDDTDPEKYEHLNHEEMLEALVEDYMPLTETLMEWLDDLILAYVNGFLLTLNCWATVDATLKGNRLVVTVGEDIRHAYFRRRRGNGRWRGTYLLPDGSAIP